MSEHWRHKAQSLRQWPALVNVAQVIEEADEFVGALLCGSIAAGTADELSDIDLIVVAQRGRFTDAWRARDRLRRHGSIVSWDETRADVPEAGAHKWLTPDLVIVECLIAAPFSGVRVAEPYAVVAGEEDVALLLERRPPVSKSEMGPTGSEVENRYDAFKEGRARGSKERRGGHMTHHYEGDDLIIRKIRVGNMENNTYVLECPATHDALLVDGCFERDTILRATDGANIVGIVQTHGHGDHVQALPALKERLDVPVYAHPAESYPVAVDVSLSDGDSINFGDGHSVRVLHTPGHTQGSVCLLIGKHLISGDTLFPGGPGNTWGNREWFEQIIESLERKLFVLPDDTAVYPGHGDDTTIGRERPHLQEWKERGW